MHSESNRDHSITVTCGGCGKVNGQGQIGTHWICEDCKVNEKDTSSNVDNDDLK